MIYTFTMTSLPTRFQHLQGIYPNGYVFYPMTLPSICFTSKTIWAEAVLAYIRRTRFVFVECIQGSRDRPKQDAFLAFLARFPDNQGFNAVRMLTYRDFSRFQSHWPVGHNDTTTSRQPAYLIARCPGLRSLVWELSVPFWNQVEWTLRKYRNDEKAKKEAIEQAQDVDEGMRRDWKAKVPEAIERVLQCGALFEVGSLRFLRVLVDVRHFRESRLRFSGPWGWTKTQWTEEILKYLSKGFERRGEAIKIEVLQVGISAV
jgi:hypothetical protein